MRLHLKEEPREWRKAGLLGLVGPVVIIGILRYRDAISRTSLGVALTCIALAAWCAWSRPRWFRSYYRFTATLGFYVIQAFGKVVLAAFFFLILTPLGWIMRVFGKDFLQLKSPPDRQTFWHPARPDGSLDSMY
jgi:hypothetical protein